MAGPSLLSKIIKNRNVILFSGLHAGVLLILTFMWMQLPWQFGDELIVARVNQVSKYLIWGGRDQESEDLKKQLLFINCSYDKMLVPFSDDFGDGTKAVVDREKLTQFFRLINTAPADPNLVVIDILFDYPSSFDSSLFAEARKIPNAVFSSARSNTGEILRRGEGLNYSLAQYESTGMFLKYSLLSEGVKTVPATMYELTQKKQFGSRLGMIYNDEGWWMNTFTVDLAIRQSQITGQEDGIVLWNLGDALKLFTPEEIQKEMRNRLIVIGDFYEFDIHETVLGPQPGPLILVNSYLSMLRGVPVIRILDILMIFLLYFFTTLYILRVKPGAGQGWLMRMEQWWVGRFTIRYLSFLFIFSCFMVIFYILTRKHYQLVLFAIYFNVFESLVRRIQSTKGKVVEKETSDTTVS